MNGSTSAVAHGFGGVSPTRDPGAGTAPRFRESVLELGAMPTAVGCGRDHTREILIEWGLSHLVDDAVLLASELLTNAMRAAQAVGARAMVLRLLANDEQLLIEAWDPWIDGYDLERNSDDAEHGRGLVVIKALSKRWGVGHFRGVYKIVWCELLVGLPPAR